MPYQQKPDQMSDKKSTSQYFIRRALAILDSLQKSSQAHANKMQILGSRSHTHTTITLLSKLHANFCLPPAAYGQVQWGQNHFEILFDRKIAADSFFTG